LIVERGFLLHFTVATLAGVRALKETAQPPS
jgi:hypothetical protein